jgi:hypothetical protein
MCDEQQAPEDPIWHLEREREALESLEAQDGPGNSWGPSPTAFMFSLVEPRPDKYYPDGQPILSDDLMPAWMKWALLFETAKEERNVAQTKTLYGERLSTVWLGLDHNFSRVGPPLIYETMLFAPGDREAERGALRDFAEGREASPEEQAERDRARAYREKHYPHDQLQLRYSTRQEAADSHEELRLQCLVPPRWRHFLLWTIGRISTWANYEDNEEDLWT